MAVASPQIDLGRRSGGRELFENAETVFDADYFAEILSSGRLKVWDGSAWVIKPAKVWDGSAWVEKPAKVWDGTSWS